MAGLKGSRAAAVSGSESERIASLLSYDSTMSSYIRAVLSLSTVALCLIAEEPKVKTAVDMSDFIQDWKISKQFTIDVANAMPTEFYTFKPNPEEMTFGEQIVHIAGSSVYRFYQITKLPTPFELDPKKMPTDKQSAVKMLEQSFDYVIAALPQITPDELQRTFHTGWKGRPDPDARAMILNMFVHVAHHRAQCEVYLRAKGIKPPDYVF